MSTLADQVAYSNLIERIFSKDQLGSLPGGSHARRYALMKRARKDGSLIRPKRATYIQRRSGFARTIKGRGQLRVFLF